MLLGRDLTALPMPRGPLLCRAVVLSVKRESWKAGNKPPPGPTAEYLVVTFGDRCPSAARWHSSVRRHHESSYGHRMRIRKGSPLSRRAVSTVDGLHFA